jgi:nitrogen fixation-related uncharacterized protein
MVMEIIQVLTFSALLLGVILIVLLFVWALKPSNKIEDKKNVKSDLGKIRDQINGDE